MDINEKNPVPTTNIIPETKTEPKSTVAADGESQRLADLINSAKGSQSTDNKTNAGTNIEIESALKKVSLFNPVIEFLKTKLLDIFFKVGFLISIFTYYINPTNFNLVIVLVYILSFLINKLTFHKKGFGVVYDKKTKKVIPNATVKVISATIGNVLGITKTDQKGRYYILLPYGDYKIKTRIETADESSESKMIKISKSHAVVDFNIGI